MILGCALGRGQEQGKQEASKLRRPKLVVGIAVDQMRWDYLYRYYDRYGEGGFKRLINDGYSFENTYINHIPSITAVGHATVFTGTVPAVHGITSNELIFNSTGAQSNAVSDENVDSVGTTSEAGKMSPHFMLADTIGDQLKLATNFRAKVIGVSLKDRAAILPAGHAADAAYWLEKKEGNWISSTYYMKELPKWVQDFNAEGRVKKVLSGEWNTLYPIETYLQSSPDDSPWEKAYKGQEKPVFPIKLSELHSSDDFTIFYNTPFGNSLVLDFAKAVIANEKLGQRGETDMLTINLPCTDSVSHQFGPNAIETEDVFLRLDRDFASFFSYLDEQIGKGQYTLFLTADHGGNHNTSFLKQHKLQVNTASGNEIASNLNKLLKTEFGVDKLIAKVTSDSELYYNYALIRDNKIDEEKMTEICMQQLRRNPLIEHVVDMYHVGDAAIPEVIRTKIVNGYNQERSGRIIFILYPNSLSLKSQGTTHRDWNPYDSKIPNLWIGWGVKKGGKCFRTVHMEDIAPTITSILRIQPPNGAVGNALPEVIDFSSF